MQRSNPFTARLAVLGVLMGLCATAWPAGRTLAAGASDTAAASDASPITSRHPARGARTHMPHVQHVPRVLGVQAYRLSVTNLNRSITFYRDVIGLPLLHAGGPAVPDRLEQSLTDIPGARFHTASFRLFPGSALLVLSEPSGVRRRVLRPHVVDPGAATLQVAVRDLAPVLAAAARFGTPIVTRGGEPLPIGSNGAHAIVLRDPDGFYVELSELPGSAPRGSDRNVLGVRMQYTVAAPAVIVRFYQGVLGLHVHVGGYVNDPVAGALFDAPGAQLAVSWAAARGSVLRFISFRHIARHTYSGRPQDAGTPALALQVNDLPAVLRAIRDSGTIVISAGGQPLSTARGGAMILVRDPAGLLVQLAQEPQRLR
jgi:catechol 2,3-dioxygenase-like lactoylglutathione lyase family enzyme